MCVTAASWVCPSVGCLNASLFTCRADSEEEHMTKPIMCQIKEVQGVADHLLVRFSGMCQDYKWLWCFCDVILGTGVVSGFSTRHFHRIILPTFFCCVFLSLTISHLTGHQVFMCKHVVGLKASQDIVKVL